MMFFIIVLGTAEFQRISELKKKKKKKKKKNLFSTSSQITCNVIITNY